MRRLMMVLGLMAALTSPAMADAPLAAGSLGAPHEAFTRPMGPDWSSAMTLPVAATTYPVYFADSGSQPAVIGWNTRVTMTATAAAACCFSMDPASTLGTASAGTAPILTDAAGPDGPCAGWFMQKGETRVVIPLQSVVVSRPGARTGVCSAPTMNQTSAGVNVYPPCDADADCTTAGAVSGTTCTAAASAATMAKSGAHILCRRAATGAVNSYLHTSTSR